MTEDLELRASDADRDRAAAVLGGALATGRLTARFGALIVNLTDAVLPGREITLEIDAFCGKLIVIVPESAHVVDEGGALFAKRAIYGRGDPGDADGPVIRIVGDARFAKVAVHRGRFDPAAPWQHWMQQGAIRR